ncbi:hypothetical protein ACE2AJ_00850 [Aquihabitans daechungensis]|uniref:hypothetical protein n=1 Tax=Aquihabitans daechungensis TaxID=1052257 RepID=UPI003BA24E33
MMPRVALAVLVVAFTAAGCSSSSGDAASTTTAPTTTTTTTPEITDREITDEIDETLRPGLESAFGKDTAECVVGVLQDGATGEISADELSDAYESQCQVRAAEVTGAIASADLIAKGATAEQGACVRAAFSKLSDDDAAAPDRADALLVACGVDPEQLRE